MIPSGIIVRGDYDNQHEQEIIDSLHVLLRYAFASGYELDTASGMLVLRFDDGVTVDEYIRETDEQRRRREMLDRLQDRFGGM